MVAGTATRRVRTSSYSMAAVIPTVTRISSRIIRILGCNPGIMTLQGTNTYLIGTGKSRILLDTGDSDVPQYINHLKTVLHNEKIDLAHIFVSHWHHDHIGGVNNVLELENFTKNCQVWKYPREDEDLPKNVKFEYLKDGQEFSVEGATVRVLHTPGHSTDHVALHLLEENAIFSADCILGEGSAVFEDLYDYLNSLATINELKPTVIYPGHGNIVQNPQEKIQYYITHRLEREAQILNELKENCSNIYTESDIVRKIYTDTPEELLGAAEINVGHHLSKLLKDQKVAQLSDGRWQYHEMAKM